MEQKIILLVNFSIGLKFMASLALVKLIENISNIKLVIVILQTALVILLKRLRLRYILLRHFLFLIELFSQSFTCYV